MQYATTGNPLDLVTPITENSINYSTNTEQDVQNRGPSQQIADIYYVQQVRYGGMGEVYLCSFKEGETPRFALKTFQKQFFYDPLYRISFENEAVNWSRLSGLPHIMPVLGIEVHEGRVYLVLPCVNNSNHINTFREELNDAACPLEMKLGHFFQCLIGFRHVNWRFGELVHGDIKPENMMIINNGIFISDFGLSKTAEELKNPQIKINLESTWAYMAPERWAGAGNESVKSDIYALGIILYEIITCRLPFYATTKEEWVSHHAQKAAVDTALGAQQKYLQPILEVALQCLQKDPANRPGFDELLNFFSKAWAEADMFAHFKVVMKQVDVMNTFIALQEQVKPAIIRGLLKLNRPDLVLLEIDNMDAAAITPAVHYAKASSLSRVNRDEEAIVEFNALLSRKHISKELRYDCMSELGLSYKRTKHFNKAESLYLDILLPTASPQQVPGIISNLSTVYLYSGEYDKGIDCLRNMLLDYPDSYAGWANLGTIYFAKNDCENAAVGLRKALVLKPGLVDLQVTLAEVYLHLGLLEDSYALLDNAWDQGYNTQRVLEDLIMVCHFQHKNDMTGNLVAAAQRDLGKEAAGAMLDRLVVKMKEIVENHQASKRGKVQKMENPVLAAPSPKVEVGSKKPFNIPFLNTRLYEDDHSYTLDFYHDSHLPELFASSFIEAYNKSRHDPRMKAGNYRMRSTLFYLTQCPFCHIDILTNRDPGKELNCRRCEVCFPTSIKNTPALDQLLLNCLTPVGLIAEKAEGQSILILVQPGEDDDQKLLRHFFTEAGYRERKDTGNKQVLYLFMEMVKRNTFVPNKDVLAFDKDFPVALSGYAKQTPLEVDALIRKIRAAYGNLRSASTMYPTNPRDVGSLMLIGKNAEALEALNKELVTGPDNFDLLSLKILLNNDLGHFADSIATAKALLNSYPGIQKTWSLLGETLVKAGDHISALPFLDKALKMDPLDTSTLLNLYKCYKQSGDKEGLNRIDMRLKSLGLV